MKLYYYEPKELVLFNGFWRSREELENRKICNWFEYKPVTKKQYEELCKRISKNLRELNP